MRKRAERLLLLQRDALPRRRVRVRGVDGERADEDNHPKPAVAEGEAEVLWVVLLPTIIIILLPFLVLPLLSAIVAIVGDGDERGGERVAGARLPDVGGEGGLALVRAGEGARRGEQRGEAERLGLEHDAREGRGGAVGARQEDDADARRGWWGRVHGLGLRVGADGLGCALGFGEKS